jgi:integrase
LAEITPKLIADYKARRYAAGLKPASINRELASLKKAFNLAVREWEWCRENPVSKVSMERENNQRDRWLSVEEEARLLQCCAPWLQDLVTFALHTGMRMGEILELTWRGVDVSRRTVMVVRSKNGERRTIPVNETVLSVLKQKSKVRSLRTDVVFCSQVFTSMESGHLRRSFRLASPALTTHGPAGATTLFRRRSSCPRRSAASSPDYPCRSLSLPNVLLFRCLRCFGGYHFRHRPAPARNLSARARTQ